MPTLARRVLNPAGGMRSGSGAAGTATARKSPPTMSKRIKGGPTTYRLVPPSQYRTTD